MKEVQTCSICEIAISEHYCSRCGQKAPDKKTTTLSLITDFLANFFSLEKSAFATILKILVAPKPIVHNYYQGYRKYYASPGKILLYSIAIIALHITFVNSNILGIVISVQNVKTQYFFWAMHFPLMLLISCLAFIKNKEDLSKHIISVLYISGAAFLVFTILNDLIILSVGDKLGSFAFVLFLLFTFIWNSRVFTQKQQNRYLILNTLLQLGIYSLIVFLAIIVTNRIS